MTEPRQEPDHPLGRTIKSAEHGRAITNLGRWGPGVPRVGEAAPDFQLNTRDGARTVRLADLNGRSGVVLIFGSYT